MRRLVFILAISLLVLEAPARQAADPSPSSQNLAIVVNLANPVEDLSSAELRRIFLGERTHWPNGRRITLVMTEAGTPERRTVLRDICRMSETDFNRHFLRGLFTGEVFVSPKTLASASGVRKFIFNVPGAIGYVRASDLDSTVRVVRINGHLPTEKDYALQLDRREAK